MLERKLQSSVEISVIFKGNQDCQHMRITLKLQHGHTPHQQWKQSCFFAA